MIEDLEKRGVCGANGPTPLDLAVKCGICKVYVGAPEGAEEQFARLRAEEVSHPHLILRSFSPDQPHLIVHLILSQVTAYADLYFDVAEALLALDSHERALEFYEPLLKDQAYNQPAIWLKIGRCHLCLCSVSGAELGRSGRDSGTALRYYTKVLKAVPDNVSPQAISRCSCCITHRPFRLA